ncbi:MAG TPA: glycosyltransferase family 2 protein [Gaiellaceae bacterium]
MERPRVAVAIVNANSGAHLGRALDALSRQTREPDRTIVVDNASTDGSLEGIEERFPSLEVLRLGENVGFAAANNLAAKRAEDCDWLALLNPDAFPEPAWLEELLAAAESNAAYSFFASRIVKASEAGTLDSTGDVVHVSGVAWQRDHGEPTSFERPAGEVFSASAAAALYRREAFVQIGGFDERFFCYYEDTDLAIRLRLAGHRCWYVPTAVVRHVGAATAGRESDFMLYHTHRNIVWTYAKNMPSPFVWLYLPEHVLINVLTLGAFLLRGRFRVGLRAKRDALRGLRGVLQDRSAVQRTRRISARHARAAMAKGAAVVPTLLRRSRELGATESSARGPSTPS